MESNSKIEIFDKNEIEIKVENSAISNRKIGLLVGILLAIINLFSFGLLGYLFFTFIMNPIVLLLSTDGDANMAIGIVLGSIFFLILTPVFFKFADNVIKKLGYGKIIQKISIFVALTFLVIVVNVVITIIESIL